MTDEDLRALDEQAAVEIRGIYARGRLTQAEVAAMCGVKQVAVSRVVRGTTYAPEARG